MWGCVYRLVCNGHLCCKPTIFLWTRYEKSFDKSVIFFLTLKKTFLPTATQNSCWCWEESVTTKYVLQDPDVLFTRCRKCSCPLSHSGSLINQSIGVPLCSRLYVSIAFVWITNYTIAFVFIYSWWPEDTFWWLLSSPDWPCEATAMFSPILGNVPTAWTDRSAPHFVQTFMVPRWCTLWLQWFAMAINFGTGCI